MAITEAVRYGNLIGKMKGPPEPREAAKKYARPDYAVEARLSALGFFHEYGTKQDLPFVRRYGKDRTKTPDCGDGPEAEGCEWMGAVSSDGRQLEEIETVGDFVRYCIEPAIERREAKSQKAKPKK